LLWTSTAEATIDDLFCLTDGLVSRIVESLALPLTVRDTRALSADVPASGRAYELYLRANGAGRTPDAWSRARDLYEEALRADPGYAPAWARLGRIHRLMAKSSGSDDSPPLARAEEAFRRALAINPELSIAHALYAQLEMETGRSIEAFARLLDRVRVRPADPQLFVGLVQAARYVGLLDVSRAAHTRAVRLDPTVKTSIAYTSFASGDHAQAVIEARAIDDPLEGFALAALGRLDEARAVLDRGRSRYGTNPIWAAYFDMAIAFAAGNAALARTRADMCLRTPFADPEGVFHVCLIFAWLHESDQALLALRRAVHAGFSCLPALTCDPALRALEDLDGFATLRSEIESRHQHASGILGAAGILRAAGEMPWS
jgi:tetratricopeptide (TPR) repeat protein